MYIYPGAFSSRDKLINAFTLIKNHLNDVLVGIKDDNEQNAIMASFLTNGVAAMDKAAASDIEGPILLEGQTAGNFYDSVLGVNCKAQFIWPNHPEGIEPEAGYQERTYISLLHESENNKDEVDNILVDITGPVGQAYGGDQAAFFHDIVSHTTFTIGHITPDEDGEFDYRPVMLFPVAYLQPDGELIEPRLRDTLTHVSLSLNEYHASCSEDRYTPVNRLQAAMDIKFSTLSMVLYDRQDGGTIRLTHSSSRAAAEAITGVWVQVETSPEVIDGDAYVPIRMAVWYGNEYVVLTILGATAEDIHDLIYDVLDIPCEVVPNLESGHKLKVKEDTTSIPVGLVLYPGQHVEREVFQYDDDTTVTDWLCHEEVVFPKLVSVTGLTLSEADRLRHKYTEPEHLAKTLDAVYERMKNAMEDIIETQFD